MSISDVITIVSLVIAIIAIINEKNRKHLLLKFNKFDFLLFTLAFCLINYFVFYEQFFNRKIKFDFLYFDDFGLYNPKHYAYLISIIILLFILFKIWYSFYPNRKKDDVIRYYKSLVETNEVSMLLDLIERYHQKDIKSYLNTKNKKPAEPDLNEYEEYGKVSFKTKAKNLVSSFWRHTFNFSKLNKYSYASYVLHNIINDPVFIAFASSNRPYFFAFFFSSFKKNNKQKYPSDLINDVLKHLLKSKNLWLIKELKKSKDSDYGQPEWFFDENLLLSSLIQDVSVSDVNEVWQAFGEEAIKEIENENILGLNSRLNQQYRNEELLWEYIVYSSIQFFKILIIEAIIQKYKETHFFLTYYWHITEKILYNLNSAPPPDFETVDSYYHKLIELMNDNLLHWLELSIKHNTDIFYDIIRCLGNQIDCLTKSPQFGQKRTQDFIESILSKYCNIREERSNVNSKRQVDLIRAEIEKILVKPSMLTKPADPYYSYISQVWQKFDKIPHGGYTGKDFDYFSQLKNNVIIPLGLNPNQH